MDIKFEFDPQKSASNSLKHGIDFEASQELWEDPNRVEITANLTIEQRFQVIGRIGADVWSAFITYRSETIRIISVRRARREEREVYYDDWKSIG